MMCCQQTRKTIFSFENGTMILARNRQKAIQLLEESKISTYPSDITNTGVDVWKVFFGPDVFVEISTPFAYNARLTAEWILYLDKRSRKPKN